MRGLIIRSLWAQDIVAGRKTWELRPTNFRRRETIALILGGSGTIIGTATLCDTLGPMTLRQLRPHAKKHDHSGQAAIFALLQSR